MGKKIMVLQKAGVCILQYDIRPFAKKACLRAGYMIVCRKRQADQRIRPPPDLWLLRFGNRLRQLDTQLFDPIFVNGSNSQTDLVFG